CCVLVMVLIFFVRHSTPTAYYTLSLHDALPISNDDAHGSRPRMTRSPQARLDEAVGLAGAIDLDAVFSEIVTVNDPRPATLLGRSEEHTSELQSRENLVCRLLLEKKK